MFKLRTPKFSRWVTIPVLTILNILAWLYIYDDYMMGWIVVYPLFMIVAAIFTIAAELAFGRDKKVKYIGINVCTVLLLFIFAQKFFPMEQVETGLKENYWGHIKADVTQLPANAKAIRTDGFSILSDSNTLEVYKKGKLIDKITIPEAIEKIQQLIPQGKMGEYDTIVHRDVRYVGFKKKGGTLDLAFTKGYVEFRYELAANEQGFIWDGDKYRVGGITLANMEGLYGDETNKKIKKIILKGDLERIINVEITPKGTAEEAKDALAGLGYKIITEEPITVEIPFYEIANLSHEDFVQHFEIK